MKINTVDHAFSPLLEFMGLALLNEPKALFIAQLNFILKVSRGLPWWRRG